MHGQRNIKIINTKQTKQIYQKPPEVEQDIVQNMYMQRIVINVFLKCEPIWSLAKEKQ